MKKLTFDEKNLQDIKLLTKELDVLISDGKADQTIIAFICKKYKSAYQFFAIKFAEKYIYG